MPLPVEPNTAGRETAELASSISMAKANETDSEAPINSNQLDIDDAIANTKAETQSKIGTYENTDPQNDGVAVTETKTVTSVTAEIEGETAPVGEGTYTENSEAEEYAGPRSGFIPAQATSLPDANSVPEAIETPARRRASLINKISGLWSTKPSVADLASRKEPAIGESQPTASILDLSQSDVVTSETSEPANSNPDVSNNELDIPAFLRRQAN